MPLLPLLLLSLLDLPCTASPAAEWHEQKSGGFQESYVPVMSLAAVLDAATDDTLLAVAIALPTPADLLRLALICRAAAQRFYFTGATSYRSGSSSAVPSGGTAAAAAAQQTETWSIIQEAARQWITTCTDQERGWVPRRGRESWLGLMWEVESLRRGAVFGHSHAHITLSEGGSLATRNVHDGEPRTAASKAVMRAGRHYAQFTVVGGGLMLFGVIRPGWDVEGGMNAQRVYGHCFYYTVSGYRFPGGPNWEGSQPAHEEGDRIGLLLDLDQGSMTVYKNDERLGVMATGLSGEYNWAVSMYRPQYQRGFSARVEAAALPAPGPDT
eukprot:COSAG06_NODE_4252_length_4429_cov_5.719169_2_plen_327_part_00